ncbi:response regulator [Candidatus Pacearchaeota archaeon]|nr:response regulator [Candidatus Pacearchaeota archaeon]
MMRNILIVDDELGVRESLRMILKDKYNLFIHSEGKEALESVRKNCIDVALLDIKMPKMDGIELLKKIKKMDPDIRVIMVTGYGTLDTAVEAIRTGAVDYICKPFDKDKLEKVIRKETKKRTQRIKEKKTLAHLETIKTNLDKSIKKLYSSTVESLLATVNAKDSYTSNHSEEVAKYAIRIFEQVGLSSENKEMFRYICSLHDIGKIGISEQVLKKKGKLTKEEWEEIKKHPEIGFSILQPIKFLNDFISMVHHHHERFDGKGYPEGKKYEEISLWTRILTVADAYHAMRSNRSYRKALSKEAAFKELIAGAGSQFDAKIVNAALKVFK